MPRSDYEQIVRIDHNTVVTLDSWGGEYVTTSTRSGGWTASLHYHSAQRLTRLEGGPIGRGPGVMTQEGQFFRFWQPFPTVYVGDRIVEDDGTEWIVQFVRQYARTLQADVERVE